MQMETNMLEATKSVLKSYERSYLQNLETLESSHVSN